MTSPSPRYLWFDLVRGLSAVAVVLAHLSAAILVDVGDVKNATVFHDLFYLVSGRSHQAVIIFFVLSGFFVGGSVLARRDTFSWKFYGSARLTRLYVVLIPALLFTALVDQFIMRSSPEVFAGEYHSLWGSGPFGEGIWQYDQSIGTFVANLFFIQTVEVPVFGSNGPLWSLANEFWYYVLFPLIGIAVGFVKNGDFQRRLLASAAIAFLLVWLPNRMLFGFILWSLGVLLWLVATYKPLKHHWVLTVVGVGILLGSLIFCGKLMHLHHFVGEAFVAIGFFMGAIPLLNTPLPRVAGKMIAKVATGLSEISYSLYLVHFPLTVLIAATFYGSEQIQPDAMGMLHFTGWFFVLMGSGVVTWWRFERRTPQVRAWLKRLKFPRERPVASPSVEG